MGSRATANVEFSAARPLMTHRGRVADLIERSIASGKRQAGQRAARPANLRVCASRGPPPASAASSTPAAASNLPIRVAIPYSISNTVTRTSAGQRLRGGGGVRVARLSFCSELGDTQRGNHQPSANARTPRAWASPRRGKALGQSHASGTGSGDIRTWSQGRTGSPRPRARRPR